MENFTEIYQWNGASMTGNFHKSCIKIIYRKWKLKNNKHESKIFLNLHDSKVFPIRDLFHGR